MLLQELEKQIPGTRCSGDPTISIQGMAFDSRKVKPGDLFIAIKGEVFDGSQFVGQALAQGAVAIASEAQIQSLPGISVLHVSDARRFLAEASRLFYGDPARKLKIIAITGTNGKTTTVHLLGAIFHKAGIKACTVGTLGMKIGKECVTSRHTTPESLDLVYFLHHAVESGCTHAALEASSHALCLKRLFGTKITVGVFTNLTQDHLDFHKDMESYYQAKRLLFTAPGNNDVESAVINIDDPFGVLLSTEVGCPVIRFGSGSNAELRIVGVAYRLNGMNLRIATPQGEIRVATQLVGRPNADNILAAAGAALSLGINLEDLQQGVEHLSGVEGRMELINPGQSFSVYVDYAHTPDALQKLLQTAMQLPHRRLITVFGCGGDRDRKKRPLMGEIAARMSDFVIATSDNPRTENPLEILHQIERGLAKGPAKYCVLPDRRAAIASAIGMAGKGDVILIAGKGHEDSQIIGTLKFPFDDRVIARESILNLTQERGEET
jgi:UDP-N-acetylmuramoyl-L-alanyl-D-glutamate--2,6-diaminopimelate ligase